MNYPYYQASQNYLQDLQQMRDRIDNQMRQIQQQSMPPITQNFQLAPTNNIKFVNSIDDVQKEIVIAETYFISNDFTNLWIKNTNGNIRTFAIQEVKPKDDKDIMIENLQKQIDELKGGNNEHIKSNDSTVSTEKPADVQPTKSSKAK